MTDREIQEMSVKLWESVAKDVEKLADAIRILRKFNKDSKIANDFDSEHGLYFNSQWTTKEIERQEQTLAELEKAYGRDLLWNLEPNS